MIKAVSALLLGASVFAAAPASAADYFIYKFNVRGDATVGDTPLVGTPGLYTNVPASGDLVFYTPVITAAGTYTYDNGSPARSTATYTIAPPGLTFAGSNRSAETYGGSPVSESNALITIATNFAGGYPMPGVYYDGFTGSAVTYLFRQGSPSTGYLSDFTGRVLSLTITEGFGTPTRFGLISGPIAAVPEPASWAMMLAGFAMIGAMGRKAGRRRSIATA